MSSPSTWISLSPGNWVDPVTGAHVGLWNISGMSEELLASVGQAGDTYTYGSGVPGETYRILNAAGADTGRTGTYSTTNFSWIDEAMLAMMLAVGAVAAFAVGGAAAGAGTAGTTAGSGTMVNGAFLGEAAWTATAGAEALTFGGTAAATTTAATATTTTAASLSGIATTAGKVLGVVSTVLGIAQQAGGSTSAQLAPGASQPINPPPPQTLIAGVNDSTVVWVGLGLGAYLLIKG